MAVICTGTFLLMWLVFALWSFSRKWPWVIAIGGGFLAGCAGLILIPSSVALADGSLRLPTTFNFAIDQLKFLSFWLVADLVLFIVYPRFLNFLSILPLIGAICGYLIVMPILHATLLVYGVLTGFGMTENHSLVGAGVFLLVVTFCLAYWVAVDNVRKGTYGMS